MKLKGKDKGVVEKVGIRKMATNSIKIYNNLCFKCRLKVMRNPRAGLCPKCKAMAADVWKGYV